MKSWRVESTAGGKSEDPKRYIPGRCSIIITIWNSDDATQPQTREMHCWIQTY